MPCTIANELERAGRALLQLAREIREQAINPISLSSVLQRALMACMDAQSALISYGQSAERTTILRA